MLKKLSYYLINMTQVLTNLLKKPIFFSYMHILIETSYKRSIHASKYFLYVSHFLGSYKLRIIVPLSLMKIELS